MIEKYGTTVPLNNKDLLEKAKRTCFEHYGVEHPSQSQEIQEKLKQYNREKFGADWVLCTKEAHEKTKQTCLEKYGVMYACMRPEASNFSNDSKPNKEFAELLDKNKIEYEREFAIENKSYDFKI